LEAFSLGRLHRQFKVDIDEKKFCVPIHSGWYGSVILSAGRLQSGISGWSRGNVSGEK